MFLLVAVVIRLHQTGSRACSLRVVVYPRLGVASSCCRCTFAPDRGLCALAFLSWTTVAGLRAPWREGVRVIPRWYVKADTISATTRKNRVESRVSRRIGSPLYRYKDVPSEGLLHETCGFSLRAFPFSLLVTVCSDRCKEINVFTTTFPKRQVCTNTVSLCV